MAKIVEISESVTQPIIIHRSSFGDKPKWHLELDEACQLYIELGETLAHLVPVTTDKCQRCDGSGKIRQGVSRLLEIKCPDCNGAGICH